MSETIVVLVAGSETDSMKSALPTLGKALANKAVEVSAEVVTNNIQQFVLNFSPLLQNTSQDAGKVYIDEIELSLVVTASGGIQLLGSAAQAGVQAGVKVKLKRR